MASLRFSNNYFDKIVVTVQSTFTRDINNILFQEISERLLRQLEFNMHWEKQKANKEDCKLVLDYEIMVSRAFL